MRQLTTRSAAAAPDATVGRLAVLACASIVAPVTALVQQFRGAPVHLTVVAVTCIALFLLVLVRMTGLVATQRQAAVTDALTGLRTRRFFEEGLRTEAARSVRNGTPLGVLLLDVDHFKNINDTYGHHGGDQVLCEIAHRLRQLSSPGDIVARYGGEEFAVLMPHATAAELVAAGEKLRRGIVGTPTAVNQTTLVTVTVSVGAAAMPAHCATADALMITVDRALYAAKETGRNRVVTAQSLYRDPRPREARPRVPAEASQPSEAGSAVRG